METKSSTTTFPSRRRFVSKLRRRVCTNEKYGLFGVYGRGCSTAVIVDERTGKDYCPCGAPIARTVYRRTLGEHFESAEFAIE